MDDDLKHKFAPRRNKRHPHLRDTLEQTAWARSLDWHNNDCHFQTLVQDVLDHLDDYFREHYGLRLDQLADREELMVEAWNIRTKYEKNPEFQSKPGFEFYLNSSLKFPLISRATDAFDKRRQHVQALVISPRTSASNQLPSPP